MSLSARVARSLEAGRGGLVSSAAALAWGALSSRGLSRPLTFRAGARVVVIGGSTLGGSGKTPLAIACAKHARSLGHRVAFVGHAYRARPETSRVVAATDDVDVVGDEALVAFHALSPLGIPVVVAPTRQAALDHALSLADVAIVDGVAQTHPVRAHLALLALDAHSPWGAGACPPAGDLRAPERALLEVCDRVVVVEPAHLLSRGAHLEGTLVPWDALRGRSIALWTSVARPRRILEHLASHGVIPRLVVAHADHASVSTRDRALAIQQARVERVDMWLCTAKCTLRTGLYLGDTPVATLEHELQLEQSLSYALQTALEG